LHTLLTASRVRNTIDILPKGTMRLNRVSAFIVYRWLIYQSTPVLYKNISKIPKDKKSAVIFLLQLIFIKKGLTMGLHNYIQV